MQISTGEISAAVGQRGVEVRYAVALGGRDISSRVGDARRWRVSSHSFVNSQCWWRQGPSNTGLSSSPTIAKRLKVLMAVQGQRFALLEEKAIISSILRRFKLESVQPKELKILLDLILKPLDPIKIKITERL
uniref:Uncharacterized protein n=1 Tax=Timema poppense TaxID=170557 RepID=A0A7R9CHV2_TIMPO|nr:unnamed protein product [Timema poppensis]